ncbi:hypothetical protein [Sporosarcina sp. FSL K6-5500]
MVELYDYDPDEEDFKREIEFEQELDMPYSERSPYGAEDADDYDENY